MTKRAPRATVVVVVATVAAVVGYAAAAWAHHGLDPHLLPWVVGRGLGLAAYLGLVALTATGLWLRHPWRLRWARPAPLTQMWVHAALAAVTGLLVVGHVVALAADSFAGVGWTGAVVPGASTYRPLAVGLGTLAGYVVLTVGLSVPLAGRVIGRRWLAVHRWGSAAFALVWLHGLLAGSDTPRLRLVYVVTGALVGTLATSRRLARSPLAVTPVAESG